MRALSRAPFKNVATEARTVLRAMSSASSSDSVLRVQVFSDTVCPWCWVGKRTLERELSKYKNPPKLELTWTPYLLDPRSPDDGITVKDYYTAKYGPEAAALQSSPENPLMKAAKNIGLPVFNDQRRIFPTITSHRLLELAQHQVSTGASPDLNVDCLVENLFHAYFIDAENLNDVDVLVKHGVEVGMEGAVVQEFLLSDVGVDHVKAWDKHAKRKLKVPSVPHFVFQTPEEGAEPVRSGGDAECLQAALKKVLDETGSLL